VPVLPTLVSSTRPAYRYCLLRWDGRSWKGGDLRAKIVARCREVFKDAKSDDEAIGQACDKSSFFCGLFRLLDVEVRLAVEPFIRWEEGDFAVFLNALPAMCAFISSGRKPKVAPLRLPRHNMRLHRPIFYVGIQGHAHVAGTDDPVP
jgi:hypothetical protein